MNEDNNRTRQMMLATMVLTGVLTEQQLQKLIDSGEPVPETWQEIIKTIQELKND